MDTFGERLKSAFKNAGYTQIKATEELHLSKNAITNYVNGRIPDATILYKLSCMLGVSMEWLIAGEDQKQTKISSEKNTNISYDLSENEMRLVELIRQVDEQDQLKIEGMLEIKIAEKKAAEHSSYKKQVPHPILIREKNTILQNQHTKSCTLDTISHL